MRKQAARFGAELVTDDVTEVDLTASPKVVRVGDEIYLGRAIVIATGSKYREIGLASEKKLAGHGVSWCATRDGFFFVGGCRPTPWRRGWPSSAWPGGRRRSDGR